MMVIDANTIATAATTAGCIERQFPGYFAQRDLRGACLAGTMQQTVMEPPLNPAPSILIRPAEVADCALILQFIKALADYEKLGDQVVATEDKLCSSLFGERAAAEVLIAEWQGQAAGFALYFPNYSTFLAQPGIYLEDLFVFAEFRGHGLGKALLTKLAALTVEGNGGRLDWSVLDWNQPSIDFYRSIGARPLSDWTQFRLQGQALLNLAEQA